MARKTRGGVAAEVMARVNAQMKDSVITLGSSAQFSINRVPTGILTIDRLLNGGFARGRHVEVYGDWMVGKSLLAYSTLALAQERGEVCALIDAERVFNAQWFRALGGDPDKLLLAVPKDANKMANTMRLLIQKTEEMRGVDICLIDSVASLLPKEEFEHDLDAGDARVGSLARLMSLLLRQLTMQNEDTLFIWTNQWRDKISRIPGLKSTPGGLALGFYASTRLEMTQAEKEIEEVDVQWKGKLVKKKRAHGRWITVTVKKEKTGARPETSKQFLLDFDTRKPDVARELIDLGMEDGIIERKGDYYEVSEFNVRAHGIKRMVAKINEDDDLRAWLVTCVEEATAEQDMLMVSDG